MAEMAIMSGCLNEAETILLHSNQNSGGGSNDDAVQMCVRLHNWDSALALAKRETDDHQQASLKSVLQQRRDYLRSLNRKEYLPIFMQMATNNDLNGN